MNHTRTLLMGLACWMAGFVGPTSAKTPDSANLVYIGMHGSQLRAARFAPHTGTLSMQGVVADHGRATWSVMHPRLPILYVVDEAGNDGTVNGSILAYRVNPETGALTLIGTVDAGGGGTTFLSIDKGSDTLVAANYGSGSVSTFPLAADGSVGKRASLILDTGSGPYPRQKGPHAHAAVVAPGGKHLLVADLGADRIFIYPFSAASHAATAQGIHAYEAPAGSGPRHMAVSQDGRFIYLINDMTGEVVTLRWEARTATLSAIDRQATRLTSGTAPSSGSEIVTSSDGRFLYAGNRTDNALLVYALDRTSGKPAQFQRIAAGGSSP